MQHGVRTDMPVHGLEFRRAAGELAGDAARHRRAWWHGRVRCDTLERRRSDVAIAVLAGTMIWAASAGAASADMVLSEVILDFAPDQSPRDDIEVFNDGTERLYVAVEPAEIKSPGTPGEARVESRDPEALGLLVTPNRLVVEPGQRKLVRIAALSPATDRDRVYRVAFKPVVGEIEASTSGIKVLIGYDVLVIRRPAQPRAAITATRSRSAIELRNDGNTNAELFEGHQCDEQGQRCAELPSKRLYAGAVWQVPLGYETPVEYSVKVGGQVIVQRF